MSIRPFFEKKDVVLCRSGIQFYTRGELLAYGFADSELPDKPLFKEYRPPAVIVKAKELFCSLPLVREHPDYWIDSTNWSSLAGGYTGSAVDVVEVDGEVCLKSSLVITTKSLYDYYKEGNTEVSVGYQAERKLTPDNPDYDLVMTEITDVNHLALTVAGRGGHNVAILDSLKNIIGGIKMARTGLFFSLLHRGKTEDAAVPFSTKVFDAIKEAEGKEGEEYEKAVKPVFDSLNDVIDCEKKEKLINAVKDTLERVEDAVANKDELCKVLDGLYNGLVEDTAKDAEDLTVKDSEGEVDDAACTDGACTDSDGKGDNTNDIADSEGKDDEGKDGEDKDAEPAVKDSMEKMIADSVNAVLPDLVAKAVQDAIGIKRDDNVTGQPVAETPRVAIDIADFMA